MITYEEARINPELRPDYLEGVMNNMSSGVMSLNYDDNYSKALTYVHYLFNKGEVQKVAIDNAYENFKKLGEKILESSFKVFCPLSMLGDGTNHPIFVYPKAFNYSEEKFLSGLIDHTGYYLNMFKEWIKVGDIVIDSTNIDQFSEGTIILLLDYNSLANQIRNEHIRKLEAEYVNELMNDFIDIGNQLEEIEPKTELEKRVLEGILSSPIEDEKPISKP